MDLDFILNVEENSISKENEELLNKLLAIQNPMDFNNDITDEQIDALEEELDKLEIKIPIVVNFMDMVKNSKPVSSNKAVFF